MTFYFDIGGFDSITTEVRLKGNHLHIYEHHGRKHPDQKPLLANIKENPDWLSLLDYCNTRKWKPEYYAYVYDGTHWSLKVSTDKVKYSCYGSNAYPRGFNKLLRLISKITTVVNVSLV